MDNEMNVMYHEIYRTLRRLEPDYVPRQEALVKVQIYVKLLYQETVRELRLLGEPDSDARIFCQ